jgi:hypothetical protein
VSRLQHVLRIALAARNPVCDAKDRFMIIAKKNTEFFKPAFPAIASCCGVALFAVSVKSLVNSILAAAVFTFVSFESSPTKYKRAQQRIINNQ